MASSLELTDVVTGEHLARIEQGFRRHFGLGLETTRLDGSAIRTMCSADCHPGFCRLVRRSNDGAERCRQDRLRSLHISIETGQPHITLCHAGIVYCCVPVMDNDVPLGALFFGKCLCQEHTEEIAEDIVKRLHDLRIGRQAIEAAVRELAVVPGRTIHQAAEFLFILLYEVTKLDPRVIAWRRLCTQQQSEIGAFIQSTKGRDSGAGRYPYEAERELAGKVRIGDRTGAEELLNSLLGTIMLQNPGDSNVLKARLVEVLSVLSRAAVEGGADIQAMLDKNADYINKVMTVDTQPDICAWIGQALNDFIESVYASQNAAKVTQIKPALDYIEAHYDQPLTLADVAKAAYLSVSRLAHLFKEQTGMTVIDHLTHVRIGHARRLLLTTEKSCSKICFEVGYNNQSYFTRTFKATAGMTPRQFRERNRRPEGGATKGLASA